QDARHADRMLGHGFPAARVGTTGALNYALRRLLGLVPTLLIIVSLAFVLVRLAPGGPFDQEQTLAPEIKANLDRAYGLDRPLPASTALGIAIPPYVTAPLLALVFGIYLHWLPVAGWQAGEVSDLVLPVVALALPTLAYLARLTRASVLEVVRLPHVRA